MMSQDLKKLLQKLNAHCAQALESATGFCVSRTHYEVTLDHLLLKLLEEGSGDIPRILSHFGIEENSLFGRLQMRLENLRTGNSGRPSFSPHLLELVESAWVAASVHHGYSEIRSGNLIEVLLDSDSFRLGDLSEVLEPIHLRELREQFADIVEGSVEETAARSRVGRPEATAEGPAGTAWEQYTRNITGEARDGRIDPVFAREQEIRQIVDILGRRRKNNPILVGEAGVGKTAVVEGLALRIAKGDVPESLSEVQIRSLDLGLLKAGASVKGEFEDRLKSVIQEVKEAPKPIVLFIDEAHMLIGAGGDAGTGDAANLLKPALARGELRTVAATTWSEYKQHIEKDAALERRFQMVKVDEPSAERAAIMLRGLKDKYEKHHEVVIADRAVTSAARLADRYISGRQLPDKAVDLIDTAASRVKRSRSAKPPVLDDVEHQLVNLNLNIDTKERDRATGLFSDDETVEELKEEREELEFEQDDLRARWQQERELVAQLEARRRELRGSLGSDGEEPGEAGDQVVELQEQVESLQEQIRHVQNEDDTLVHAAVTEGVVARIVSDWTGIPVGNMVSDEAEVLLSLEDRLREHIRGQDEAVEEIADGIRASKAGVGDPETPIGVFLMVGPSGVGKTETARTLAQTLFGGERFLTVINMSEYQESHTAAQLKGSPPGYVGYGEGGVLTEAVRRQPYSVILLDEVEKAHPDVMELFYQVFDKGFMRDGEGREVSFQNTVVMMTSNVGADLLLEAANEDERPKPDELREKLHPLLVRQFQAALIARMKTIPFYPLPDDVMKEITRLKLNEINDRLVEAHDMRLTYADGVVDRITERCTQVDAGARNIDFIVDRTLLPEISRRLLAEMTEEEMPARLTVDLDDTGAFTYTFDGKA